ncbi:MAG: hypothetical protein ABEI58_02720 [Candidatus Nanohaloarchaea archaeon]
MFSLFFLWILDRSAGWKWQKITYKFTAALTLFCVSLMTQTIEQTWHVINFYGISIPPLQVWFEAIVGGFLISGIWDFLNLDED